LKEVRIHGRGGQGAVTLAELIAYTVIKEGRYAQSFPSFGPERRGAPVLAFLRVNNKPIKIRAEVTEPDVVVVLDPGLMRVIDVTDGIKEEGVVVINTNKSLDMIRSEFKIKDRLVTVDASKIARDVLGRPITNTTMVGALLRAVELADLEDVGEEIRKHFGEKLGEKNVMAMKRAFEEAKIGG
jgi:pyruvate ferredoxin oxidoreductase gamma subunit